PPRSSAGGSGSRSRRASGGRGSGSRRTDRRTGELRLALEAPLTAQELVRPWRRAPFVASSLAAGRVGPLRGWRPVLVAGPLSRAVQRAAKSHVENESRKAVAHAPAPVRKEIARQHAAPPKPSRTRAETKVLVLNGNGRTGVAHAEAAKLQSLGYEIAGAADGSRHV